MTDCIETMLLQREAAERVFSWKKESVVGVSASPLRKHRERCCDHPRWFASNRNQAARRTPYVQPRPTAVARRDCARASRVDELCEDVGEIGLGSMP